MKTVAINNKLLSGLVAVVFLGVINAYSANAYAVGLLNSSYDISRELFFTLNPQFEKQWNAQHPQDKLIIKQSHAGSSKQALSILQGLRADVVTYNQVTDVQILHDRGNLIPADWQQRLPNNSSPYYSTMAFLVRKDNPKQIHTWDDLVRHDVKLIFPNPKTSGNGRYTYLAAWGAFQQQSEQDPVKVRQLMRRLLQNVAVFDTGGRGATTSFIERSLGDVLISFESEVNNIRKQYGADNYEVIVPPVDILAEFPVTWIDKNVRRNRTEAVAKAYLNYLYSPAAQQIIASFNYRVNDKNVMEAQKPRFPETRLFRLEEQFGSWPQVMKTHFSTGGMLDQLLAEGHK
ncbi:sulfate ABC transporter substrate-binding protein [Xenorhabdus bovienii]|uniref:Thiosulfate transport protein (ABC superfamily,peri_bind) n=1 Tax=Xenorhabdus bovienii str. puntauvense TaxID=1398201 RepID=A0A077NNN4_XENBV|nr:sulfate ABC transporter substrate-binding protein [Xenorhabdus bovienii]CDG87247.1 thiosulfate transport protein (ABC superfamily,peri_bind) [Xenorhabdus bovienii str. feltiae France]CDG92531.1 thiosulfate transport protein (ABC superfamily,peri_bind) [Xenorhabdus bovienii str. feltiae Florida]CDG99260.1 thiosulfate transport protein (ABC superfamily,peri_bind) [Xenorhabdus bovienii str. puntauvense]